MEFDILLIIKHSANAFGDDHIYLALIYDRKGELYYEEGMYKKSLQEYEKSIEIRKK